MSERKKESSDARRRQHSRHLEIKKIVWHLGLARSLDFSGLGLSVFWHVRTEFRFGLFQSLIVYKIESYHLQFRDRRG